VQLKNKHPAKDNEHSVKELGEERAEPHQPEDDAHLTVQSATKRQEKIASDMDYVPNAKHADAEHADAEHKQQKRKHDAKKGHTAHHPKMLSANVFAAPPKVHKHTADPTTAQMIYALGLGKAPPKAQKPKHRKKRAPSAQIVLDALKDLNRQRNKKQAPKIPAEVRAHLDHLHADGTQVANHIWTNLAAATVQVFTCTSCTHIPTWVFGYLCNYPFM